MGVITLCTVVIFASCSKDDAEEALNGKTEIVVYLKDSDGTPLKEWVVYAYNQIEWRNKSVLAKQSATNAEGKATFVLDEVDITDTQEVYHFAVYYTKTKTNILGNKVTSETLVKAIPVTIKQGENKVVELNLN